MKTTTLYALGAIAGLTIFLGLPLGRVSRPMQRTRAAFNAVAIGILVFLLYDILGHANEPVEHALTKATDGAGSWLRFSGLAAVFAIGLGAGLISLLYVDRSIASRREAGSSDARRLALFIAMGIGLHNFSEGLAIGQSAGAGEIGLATVLIIGFALHNGTEGFGIVAPLAAEGERPSWGFLAMLGVIGGAPTFLGTVVGRSFINDVLFLAFLALAAGSILYVVIQLLKVAQRLGNTQVLLWGLLAGIVAGFGTDYVLVAAGG